MASHSEHKEYGYAPGADPCAIRSRSPVSSCAEICIEDGRRQAEGVGNIVDRVLNASEPRLTKYGGVLLSRDLFGHIEDHFHQRVRRNCCGPLNSTPDWLMF